MNTILEIKGVSKKYQNKKGEVLALDNVNFRVKEGEKEVKPGISK